VLFSSDNDFASLSRVHHAADAAEFDKRYLIDTVAAPVSMDSFLRQFPEWRKPDLKQARLPETAHADYAQIRFVNYSERRMRMEKEKDDEEKNEEEREDFLFPFMRMKDWGALEKFEYERSLWLPRRFDFSPAAQDDRPGDGPLLQQFVFLGNSNSMQHIAELGITRVLAIHDTYSRVEPAGHGEWLQLELGTPSSFEWDDNRLASILTISLAFLEQGLDSGASTLLAGGSCTSRCAAVLIALVMKRLRLSLGEAWEWVRAREYREFCKRASPAPRFFLELLDFEYYLFGCRRTLWLPRAEWS
jgi:hypothetical protein